MEFEGKGVEVFLKITTSM